MKNAFILFLGLVTLAAWAGELSVGEKAPAFQAKADDGNTWLSKNHVGEGYVVVYFYPAAMTGGCTAQACSFRDNQPKLDAVNATVVGVSGDDVDGLKIFKMAHNLDFTLLSDINGDIAKKFGVPVRKGGSIEKEVDGKTVTLNRGVTTSRWTFIIGPDGKIVYKDTDVQAAKDSQTVLEFLKSQKQS
jgi:thioredoxin-dependent peroxiredoxin